MIRTQKILILLASLACSTMSYGDEANELRKLHNGECSIHSVKGQGEDEGYFENRKSGHFTVAIAKGSNTDFEVVDLELIGQSGSNLKSSDIEFIIREENMGVRKLEKNDLFRKWVIFKVKKPTYKNMHSGNFELIVKVTIECKP